MTWNKTLTNVKVIYPHVKDHNMKSIKSMFDEVQYELPNMLLLNVFLESAVLFLLTHLILSVFSMPLIFSGIVAAVFFAVRFYLQSRSFDLKKIEKKNPEIREMLRTANDNKENNSLMAQALFTEVLEKMRKVSSGTFINIEMILKRIGAIFVLSVVLVGLAFFNIDIAKFDNPLAGPMATAGGFIDGLTGEEPSQEGVDLADDDLYGDSRMAELGNEDLNIEIKQGLNQVDFSNLEDPDTSEGNIKDFPGQSEAVSDSSFEGGLDDVADRKAAAEYAQQVR